jgi:hypothetical protein
MAADYPQFEAWAIEEQCEEEAQEEEAVVQAAGSAASPQGQSHLALSSHHGNGVSTEQLRRDVFPPGEKPFPLALIHSGCVGPESERSFHRGAPHNSQRRLGQQDRSTEEILKDGEAWQSIPQVQWKVQHWDAAVDDARCRGDDDAIISLGRARSDMYACTMVTKESWVTFIQLFNDDIQRVFPGVPLMQDGTVDPWPDAGPEEDLIKRWQAYHFKTSSGIGGRDKPSLSYMRNAKSWLCQLFTKMCTLFLEARGKSYVKKACSRSMNAFLQLILIK